MPAMPHMALSGLPASAAGAGDGVGQRVVHGGSGCSGEDAVDNTGAVIQAPACGHRLPGRFGPAFHRRGVSEWRARWHFPTCQGTGPKHIMHVLWHHMML